MAVLQGSAKSVADGGFYPKTIDQSLRFNDNDSAYLSRTPSSAGNRKTWTFSCWFKCGNLGINRDLFACRVAGTDRTVMRLNSDDTLFIIDDDVSWQLVTTQVFRDPSAWYHLVLSVDTTQATSSDRVKVYINGERVTSFSTATYPSLNYDTRINSTAAHQIGNDTLGDYFDGYLAEVHFTDGTAYTADDFGEFKSGVWVAKTPSVTYGTNGFYLDFADSGNIGNDANGSNNWTPINLASTDVMLDSPTNNFATLNPLDTTYVADDGGLFEGNLKLKSGTGGSNGVGVERASTINFNSGKFYAEFEASGLSSGSYSYIRVLREDNSSRVYIGFCTATYSAIIGTEAGTQQSGLGFVANGDIISVSVDADADTVSFYKNNVQIGVAQALTGTGSIRIAPQAIRNATQGTVGTFVANFGQDSSFAGTKTPQGNTDANGIGDFYYAPPTGYLALCTANLPEPSISPLNDASPSDYMNTVLYSGNSTDSTAITGVGFQPDLLWIKARNAAYWHVIADSVRGLGTGDSYRVLSSNSTDAEATAENDQIRSLDADGFTLDDNTDISYGVNISGQTYVAWNWKANGTGVSNTDGSITSTVSANVDSGFSIATWTGTGAVATVGHGLSQAPEMIITKGRSYAQNWVVYHNTLGATKWLQLNGTTAALTETAIWNNTAPTSSVFTVGTSAALNPSGGTNVTYCFHSVEGFSKIGSYTGNGSADGPFVYCGFKPAFVMVKRTDGANGWNMWDSERGNYNVNDKALQPNTSGAEASGAVIDFLSNGFKPRDGGNSQNGSGANYIFIAFSSNPFKYSTAR